MNFCFSNIILIELHLDSQIMNIGSKKSENGSCKDPTSDFQKNFHFSNKTFTGPKEAGTKHALSDFPSGKVK